MDEGIAVVVAVALFGLPVAGWIVVRSMEHAERMEMIRRGMMPPPYASGVYRTANPAGILALAAASIVLLAVAFVVGVAAIAFPAEGSIQIPSWLGAAVLSLMTAALFGIRMRALRGQKRIKDAGASLMIIDKK